MAKPHLLLQGFRKANDHESAINNLLRLSTQRILLSVAFVRRSGVKLLETNLKQKSPQIVIYVGIRNGVTSVQGLLELLRTGVRVVAVDTGSVSNLFHPKLYLAVQRKSATLIIGSANLTTSGLNENIEASAVLVMDRKERHDKLFLASIIESFDSLQRQHPRHVFLLRHDRDVVALFRQGRLEDEELPSPRQGSSLRDVKGRDTLPKISLFKKGRRLPEVKPPRKAVLRRRMPNWVLVWTSKKLTERDLNVPTGSTTHSTGSMLFKKGALRNIDQRTYFRELVFQRLSWLPDPRPKLKHLERTQASFEISIKGINYGTFPLKLTHNSRKDSRAFKQLNAMTQIHWGDIRGIIAKRDLLGRELHLFRKDLEEPRFLIEID